MVGHNHFAGASQVVGTSISVGMRIFSIVGGLGSVGGRSRESGRLLLEGLALRLLHKLRKRGEAWERPKSWLNLIEGFRSRGQ